jgi:hypothetical protein
MLYQSVLYHLGFSGCIELGQYLVVLSQPVVDIPNQVFALAVDLVVIGVSTIVTAELLVASSFEGFSAFEAGSFFHR